VAFHNTGPGQLPGLLVMSLSDKTAVDVDPAYEFIVVLINANDEALSFTDGDLAGMTLGLHPVQAASVDAVVKTASYAGGSGTFEIPARTTAVFVEQESAPSDPCPDVPGNLIANYCFEDGPGPWTFFTDGRGTFKTASTDPFQGQFAAETAIIEAGGNVQLFQRDISLKPNTEYEISFAAQSSNGRDLSVFLQQHGAPFTNYGLRDFRADLTPGWAVYRTTFVTTGFSSPVTDARLRFWMAPFDQDGMTYRIDWVVLREYDSNNPPDPIPTDPPVIVPPPGQCGPPNPANLLSNSGFESGTAGWTFFTDGRGAFDTAAGDPYECAHNARVSIQRQGSNVQLFQNNLTLQGGQTYQLRLAARSSGGQDVKLFLHQHSSPFESYGLNGIQLDLTPAWQVFVVEFTARGRTTLTDGRLRLWLAPFDQNGAVYEFDDVLLIPAAAATTAAPDSRETGAPEQLQGRKKPPKTAGQPANVVLEQGYFLDGDEDGRLRGAFVGARDETWCYAARASAVELYPANGRMARVRIVGAGRPRSVIITGITQNEPPGPAPDGSGVGSSYAQLRRERDDSGEGRVYHVAFTAVYKGKKCAHEVVVSVPVDRRSAVIDTGAGYDSTVATP
jgi:hypothetical protein